MREMLEDDRGQRAVDRYVLLFGHGRLHVDHEVLPVVIFAKFFDYLESNKSLMIKSWSKRREDLNDEQEKSCRQEESHVIL